MEFDLRMIAGIGIGGEGAGDAEMFAGMEEPETIEEEKGEEEVEEGEGEGITSIEGGGNEQTTEDEDVFSDSHYCAPLV